MEKEAGKDNIEDGKLVWLGKGVARRLHPEWAIVSPNATAPIVR